MQTVVLSYLPDKVLDGWTDRRIDKAATICFPFGEHKNKQHNNEQRY